MGKVAGTIGTDKAPRRKLSLADRLAALDAKIARAESLAARLKDRREALKRDALAKADALRREAESVERSGAE